MGSHLRARRGLRALVVSTVVSVAIAGVSVSGAGAASRHALGLVITMGMGVGTMFTLFIVPMFYTYIAERPRRIASAVPA